MGQKLRRVPKGHLRKILVQTGNFDAVERLREYFKAAQRPPPYARGSGMESEVHVAAACVDVEGRRVLMRRRPLGKGVEKPGVWDFGCAVLTGQRPAPETLVDEYETKYGIDLVVDDATPLSYFSFLRRGRFVSGFVFGVRARNPNAKLAPHNDHQLAWFDLDQPPPSDSVQDASAVFAGLRARYA